MSDENRYKEVHADKWVEMSVHDLYEQLSILQGRAYTASVMHNIPMLQQLQKGIERCNEIIASKSDGDDTVTL